MVKQQLFFVANCFATKITNDLTKITKCYNNKNMCLYQLKVGSNNFLLQINIQQKSLSTSTKCISDDNKKHMFATFDKARKKHHRERGEHANLQNI